MLDSAGEVCGELEVMGYKGRNRLYRTMETWIQVIKIYHKLS